MTKEMGAVAAQQRVASPIDSTPTLPEESRAGSALRASHPSPAASTWCLDMERAPRDGTLLQLLIGHDDGPDDCTGGFDDADQTRTMGFNNFDNDEVDDWKFPGWDWCHDCITEQGCGKPVAWALMLPHPSEAEGSLAGGEQVRSSEAASQPTPAAVDTAKGGEAEEERLTDAEVDTWLERRANLADRSATFYADSPFPELSASSARDAEIMRFIQSHRAAAGREGVMGKGRCVEIGGPFGWLIKPHECAEDEWFLADDPAAAEYAESVPLFAIQGGK